jgi:hypothetical protein
MVIGKVFPVGYGFSKPAAAIPVLFLSFAVGGLAVVLIRNPLELMEDEFRTFAALVSLLKLLMPLLLVGVYIFEIIVLLSAVSVVLVALGGAAIPVLFLSFAVAVGGLAVVLTGNPLELLEDEFRTFAALVNVARRIIKAIDTTITAINGI